MPLRNNHRSISGQRCFPPPTHTQACGAAINLGRQSHRSGAQARHGRAHICGVIHQNRTLQVVDNFESACFPIYFKYIFLFFPLKSETMPFKLLAIVSLDGPKKENFIFLWVLDFFVQFFLAGFSACRAWAHTGR